MTDSRVSGVHTVGVPVRDQDKAVEFYTTVLGMQKRMDVSMGNGGRWIEVAPAARSTSIALVPAKDSAPAGVETGIRLTTADADDLHAFLVKNAVDADDVLRWPGVPPMFAFRDQDGNGLEIVQEA
jgi:lactoylglutathione lyase